MALLRWGVLAALLAEGATVLCAQQPSARPMEPMPSPATQSSASSSATESNDVDELGQLVLLQSPPSPKTVDLSSETDYLYNSNILLLPKLYPAFHPMYDSLLFETLNFSYSPQLVNKLSSTIFLRQQVARYDKSTAFNFDAQAAGLQLAYPVDNLFTAYGGFAATRMYFDEGNTEFFKMYDTQLGLYRSQAIRSHASLFYGAQVDWEPADPSILSVVDSAAYIGLNVSVTDKLSAQALYRFSAEDYTQSTRSGGGAIRHHFDYNHLGSFALTYAFNEYVALRAFTDYADNKSSLPMRDYDVFDGGGGLDLSIKF